MGNDLKVNFYPFINEECEQLFFAWPDWQYFKNDGTEIIVRTEDAQRHSAPGPGKSVTRSRAPSQLRVSASDATRVRPDIWTWTGDFRTHPGVVWAYN